MGGLQAGPVERVDHDYQLWEKRVDALMVLLSRKRRFTVDELRKGIESLPGDAYDRLTYYERWIGSIASALVHRGTISIEATCGPSASPCSLAFTFEVSCPAAVILSAIHTSLGDVTVDCTHAARPVAAITGANASA